MTSAVLQRPAWSRRRWWRIVALVFFAQAVVIYWLGERGPVKPRPQKPVQTLRFAQNVSAEWLALNNPTLFALPHREGFSAGAWMTVPSLPLRPFEWTENPDWLRLPVAGLGVVGARTSETPPGAGIRIPPMTTPDTPGAGSSLSSAPSRAFSFAHRGPFGGEAPINPPGVARPHQL